MEPGSGNDLEGPEELLRNRPPGRDETPVPMGNFNGTVLAPTSGSVARLTSLWALATSNDDPDFCALKTKLRSETIALGEELLEVFEGLGVAFDALLELVSGSLRLQLHGGRGTGGHQIRQYFTQPS